MTQSSSRTVSYTLASRTSGVPGLEKFASSLERIRTVQDQIKRQGEVLAGLRDKTVTIRMKFEAASLTAELARIQNRTVTINVRVGNLQTAQNDITALKTMLNGLGANMTYRVVLTTTALNAVYTNINTQITALQSLISQLRALGGGGGGGGGGAGSGGISAANRTLLAELEALNNSWKRGDIGAAAFGTQLTALQGRLRTASAGATAGTADFRALDAGLTRLTGSLRSINTDAFQKLRTDAGAMRAAFDAATAGFRRNSTEFRAASSAYATEGARITAQLQNMARAGNLTTTQLGQVNREIQRLAREQNTIRGGINSGGLSGNIVNSFGMLPGQLGMMASQGGAAINAISGIALAAGPAGLAVAGLGVATLGAAFAAGKAVNEYAKFEAGLAQVATLTDKTTAQLGETGRQILKISGEVGATYTDLNAGLYDVLGAGVKGTESMTASLQLLRQAAMLGKAGATDTKTATDVLTSVMNAYQLSATDATMVSDKLFKAVDDGKMSFSQLALSLGMVLPTAKMAGLSLDEVLGSVAALTAQGVRPSSAIEYLRSALTNIIKPSMQAKETAADLGIQFDAQGLKAKGLTGFLRDVIEKTDGNSEAMARLFGDIGALTAVTGLANGDFQRLTKTLEGQADAAGKTAEAYSKVAATIESKSASVAGRWKALWVNVGESFAPVKLSILTGIDEMLTKLNSAAELTQRLRNTNATQNKLAETERGITANESAAARARAILADPNASAFARNQATNNLPKYEAILNQLRADLVTLKADMVQQQADFISTSNTALPKGVQGPNFGGVGAPVDMSSIPAEAGKFGYAYISKLKDVFVNDPKVDSDCAVIATAILQNIGVQIKGSANAGVLEKNAVDAKFQKVNGDEIRPGDLIVWTSGNGKTYGKVSGKHVGVAAGVQNGKLMVINNPGSSNTQVEPMYDRQNAVAYRAPTSAFDFQGNLKPDAAPGSSGGGGNSDSATTKSFDAYMTEARRTLAQIEKYAPQGSAPDGAKWAKASAYLKAFTKDNDVAAQALAYVQLETKKADKTTSQYGQTFDRLKGKLDITQSLENLGRPSAEITKQLSAIGTSASQAAEAERKRNGETAKYRVLLDLAGDAAKRLKTIQDRKPEQTPVQREQAALAELRSAQAQERAFRAAGTQRLSNIIKGGVQKEGDLDRVKGAEAELKRRADLETEAGKQAKKALEENAELIGKLAEETAKAAVERSKEQAQLRAKYASERRNLDVQEAEADLARTQDLNRKELADFKGTAAQRVDLIKRQAQDEFNATEQVARATRDRSIREFQNAGGPNQGRNIDGANQAYKDAVSKAQNIQTAAGTQATEDQNKAVREARDGYSKLADSMREKIVTGKVEIVDLTAYRVGMGQAAEAAEKGGVAQQKYVKGARASAEALYQAGIDAQIAAGMFADLGDGQSRAAEAGKSYAVSLEDALAAMPGTIEGNADYLKLLQEMAATGQISGTVVAHISDLMRDQAIDAQIAAGAYADVADSYDRAARAGQGYVATQQDALDQIPGSTEANAAYVKVLQDLESAGKIAPGTVEAVSQSIRDQEVVLANTTAWMERLTTEAGKAADALVELGDTDGAMRTLQEALDEAWAASNRGEDAAATIADLTDKINALAKSTALAEGFNSFFSMLSGTIEEQISQVVDQLDRVTDPAMVARLKALLDELRQGVMPYEDPSRAGYTPNSDGGGFTGQTSSGLTPEAIAAARDLTAALNTELDPATLGTAMTGAADLLASEVGQALPAATRKGLEEGLKNAQAYQDALASTTEDAVIDGWERGSKNVAPLPENRFQEFASRIQGGEFDLSDSNVLKGLTDGLDLAASKGQLTADQLEIIKLLIDSINASPVDVLPDAERWQQVDEWNDKLGKLEASLESGASTQDEFTASALEALPALERLAEAAEKQSKTDLAAAWRAAAAGVRQLGGEALEAAEKLLKLQATATGLESIGNGLSSIFNAFGLGDVGKLSSALGGVFKAGLNIQSSYKAIGPAFQKSFGAGLSAVGSFLGPVGEGINLVGQIGQAIMDLSPGFQAWKKDLLEVAEIQKKALGAGTGGFESPWAKQLQEDAAKREKLANGGFWQQVWWGLTGSAPQVMKTESAKLLAELQTIFASLGEGISSAMSSSMTDAFLKGDMADFAANFEKSFDQVVGKVVLQTMIEAAVQEGAVAQDLGELTQAIKDRRYNDIPSILARIKQHAGEAMAPIAALAPSLPGYGSGGGSGGSGGSEPTISPVDKRRRDELLYRYENATDPAEKERLRKELLGLDPSSGGGGSTTTVTLSPVKTETPDWAALNAGINRLADFGAQSDQIARMESETARMNRESAGVMAQAAGMMLLASQGRGSGTGPGNINF